MVIKGSGRGAARRRGVLARPDGEEHGETEEFPGFGNAVGEICCGRVVISGRGDLSTEEVFYDDQMESMVRQKNFRLIINLLR